MGEKVRFTDQGLVLHKGVHLLSSWYEMWRIQVCRHASIEILLTLSKFWLLYWLQMCEPCSLIVNVSKYSSAFPFSGVIKKCTKFFHKNSLHRPEHDVRVTALHILSQSSLVIIIWASISHLTWIYVALDFLPDCRHEYSLDIGFLGWSSITRV